MSFVCGQSPDDAQEAVNHNRPICHSHIEVDPLSAETPAQVASLVYGMLDQYHRALSASERRLIAHTKGSTKKEVESMVFVVQHARNAHMLLDQFAIQVLEDAVPMAVVLGRQKDKAAALKVAPTSPRRMLFGWTQPDIGRCPSRGDSVNSEAVTDRRPIHVHTSHPTIRADLTGCQPRSQEHVHASNQPHLETNTTDHTGQGSPTLIACSWISGISRCAGIAKAFFSRLWSGIRKPFRHVVSFWTAVQNLATSHSKAGGSRGLPHTLTEEEENAIDDFMADLRVYVEPDWEFQHSDEVLNALIDLFEEGRLGVTLNSEMSTRAE